MEYVRGDIINTKMTLVTAEGSEEHDDVELQEYSADDGTFLSIELWESWLTFYVGEEIGKGDVNVFPMAAAEE